MNDPFNPMDTVLWPCGPRLAWWDSATNLKEGRRPRWATDPDTARKRLNRRHTLAALGAIHSHRTAVTGQLARLAPGLPRTPAAMLWRDMAGLGLIDLGFPMNDTGRWAVSPAQTRLMGIRLPVHRDITSLLEDLGYTAADIASLGPRPLRGARQYDRHNLICTELSCRFRETGLFTCGEAWGRFDLLFHDALAGRGGPDLQIIRPDGLVIAVEATASATGLPGKIRRWTELLDAHPDAGVQVVWLDCTDEDGAAARTALSHVPGAAGRMHLASAADWLDGHLGRLSDGDITDLPYDGPRRARPDDWMRPAFDELCLGFGLDSRRWPLPPGFTGGWYG